MIEARNTRISIMFLLFLVVSLLSVSLSQAYISLEKESYGLGEQVKFVIESSDASQLEIIQGEKVFRLIGNVSGEHRFFPESSGVHVIRIIGSGGSVISSKEFMVGEDLVVVEQNNIIQSSKPSYSLGEEAKILLLEDVKVQSVRISSSDSHYSLVGEPEFPLSFYPDKEGAYEVIVTDSAGKQYKAAFEVLQDSSQPVTALYEEDSLPFTVRNSKGSQRRADINLFESAPTGLSVMGSGDESSLVAGEPVKGKEYDVEVKPLGSAVKNLRISKLVYDERPIVIDDLPVSGVDINRSDVASAYAVRLESGFEKAVLTSTAIGTELYVCNEWDVESSTCNGEWNKKMDITPGEDYEVEMSSSSNAYAETGVASVNTNKSIYRPGEVASITMVVLDTEGYLVSGAVVTLEITSPEGNKTIFSTSQGSITEESTGIYKATYNKIYSEGTYYMVVNATGRNVDSSMSSYFLSKEYFEFDILRSAPVTIDPKIELMKSSIQIISYSNTSGFSFTEVLPSSFSIVDSGGATVSEQDDKILLSWHGLQNNSKVAYTVSVPEVIPYLWSIGPSVIEYEGEVFTEARPWYLAVDPLVFYDPTSTITNEWSQGTGTTHTEINEGVRQPTAPSTSTYVASRMNDNEESEFGFSSIAETDVEEITLWVYTGTGSNAQYTFSLRQGTTTVCSELVPSSTSNSWRSCTWSDPSGSLDDMRIHLSTVTRDGGGGPTDALVFAAYLEVDTGIPPPDVELVSPGDNAVVEDSSIDFTFRATDNFFSTIDQCTLYANFSGSWESVESINNVQNNTNTIITRTVNDGVYIWNVLCDNTEGSAFAPTNYTLNVNAVPPLIENAALNESVIRQNRSVYFNATITDSFGIDTALITLKMYDDSLQNITLDNAGDEYYTTITNTINPGIYEVTLIWANDTLGQVSQNTSLGLSFEVQAIPPDQFNLLSPPNATESRDLTPTLEWEEASTPDFANYTILIDKGPGFGSLDFTYHTFSVDDTSLELPLALDANDVYYWKVIAYDVFGNSRNSTDYFKYINDRTPPTVTLNNPANNDFTTNEIVMFNYTPNDQNTIDSCTLYGNFSGSWQPVHTNYSISKGQPNFFSYEVVEGVNTWNVQCNDSAGNAAFASQNRTIILDQTGPIVNLNNPANNSLIDDTNIINFYAVAYDELAQVDSCSLYVNETLRDTKSGITDNVEFNFTLFLTNDYYSWRVQCNDTNGNADSSETFFLTVESLDTDPPVITLNRPLQNQYLQSGDVNFNYTVEDATGIENCSLILNGDIYDTDYNVDNFANNFFFASGLAEQEHNWSVACYDNSSELNYGVSSTRFFTVDLSDPVVTLNAPANDSFLNYNTIDFNYTPVEDNLDYCTLYTNQSGAFQPVKTQNNPVSGEENILAETIPDGIIIWNIRCFDLSGRNTFAVNNYTLSIDTTPPQYFNIDEDPDSPATYAPSQSYYFSVEWTDNFELDTVVFEHNFTGTFVNETPVFEGGDLYSFTTSDLPVGSYRYRWYANDTSGNENQTGLITYEVVKDDSEVQLLLNGSANNITINENDVVNMQVSLVNPSSGYVELYLDGSRINSGAAPLQNNTFLPYPGTYNVTAVYNETQNHTSSSSTLFITVEDVTPPLVTLKTPANNSFAGDGEVTFTYNVSDNSPIQSCSLYINGSLEETNTDVQRNTDQFFYVDMDVGDYYWNVSCTDEADNTGGSSPHFFEVVDVDELVVTITFGEGEYEVGDTALITTTVTDIFENPLTASVYTSIISGETTTPWWNSDWNKRRPIVLDETTGEEIVNGITRVNITGLGGFIDECATDIRIISHASLNASELPFEAYDGDDSSWCAVYFLANLSASETNNMDYYVYYDNPSATNPGYGFSTIESAWFNAIEAAADEGSPTGVANIIGKNDGTYASMLQQQGGGTHSAHGRALIDEIPGEDILSVRVRYRYEVPDATNLNWQLRYSVNGGTTYTNSFTGTTMVSTTTSAWHNITGSYTTLSWSDLNNTRLQGRMVKSGGGQPAELRLYWVEMEVYYREFSDITSTSVEDEEMFLAENSGTTSGGTLNWYWSSQGFDVGDYSVVSLASRESYTTSSGMSTLNIVPDETPPNVSLISPFDGEERGKGLVNFTYIPFDINLDACTLYIGPLNGSLEPNVTDSSPVNNDSNTFENVFVDVGLWEWNVWCNDTEGNNAFAPENFLLNISAPDLVVTDEDIWFDYELLVEGANVTVFANISNEGLSDAEDDFAVQFFQGDPAFNNQIGSDIIVNGLESFETITVSRSYQLVAGDNNIFVVVDPYDDVNESDTDNNIANNTLTVELYQYYYGGSKADIVLASGEAAAFLNYLNLSGLSGHVFFADADSSFSFGDLQALTRNVDGNLVSGDFAALDSALGTTDFKDSIRNIWGDGTETPIMTRTFNLSSGSIHNVPVVYSTEYEDFVTGILWDTSDDTGNQRYDASDKEDVVFVTEINPGGQGRFGVYDYEIRVPAVLRDYAGSTDKLAFYVEIR